MANFTITISNSLNVFGIAPADLWNAYDWNAFLWGEGTTDLPVTVGKVLDNSTSSDSSQTRSQAHSIDNTVGTDVDMGNETLSEPSGWSYVFPNQASNLEDRDFTTWTEGTSSSTTWTTATAASTTWS